MLMLFHLWELSHLESFSDTHVFILVTNYHFLFVNLLTCYSPPQTSELGVTEHVEGDPCKFALWVGRTPTSDNKIVLKVSRC